MIAEQRSFRCVVELPEDDTAVYKCERLPPLAANFTADNVCAQRAGISALECLRTAHKASDRRAPLAECVRRGMRLR